MLWKSEKNTNSYSINKFQSLFDLIFLRNEEKPLHICVCLSLHKNNLKNEEVALDE